MKAIRGGLHLDGNNSWLGAGDFSGGCISGMVAFRLLYRNKGPAGPGGSGTERSETPWSANGAMFSKDARTFPQRIFARFRELLTQL